nr:sterol desaturase family protein [Herbaspirillum sp. ASV7]
MAMSLLQSILSHLPGFATDVLRLCLWLVLLTALFAPLERWFAVREQKLDKRALAQDLGFYFLSSLTPALVMGFPLAMIAELGRALLPAGLLQASASLPLLPRLSLAFVVGEVGFYWGHRLSHEIPWLWRFHAVHHRPQQMYYLVNTRAHPVDLVLTRLFGLTPLYLFGLAGPGAAGMATPVAVILIGTVWGFFIHSNVRFRFRPLEWVLATPVFHHWHHSRVDHINRNYASTFPLLDRLFGTYYLPQAWPADYGVAEDARQEDAVGQPGVKAAKAVDAR